MAYGDFKGLAKRTAADRVLRDKAFNIAKNPKDDGYQRGLASMVYKLFYKKVVSLRFQINLLLNLCAKMNNCPKNFIKPLLTRFWLGFFMDVKWLGGE